MAVDPSHPFHRASFYLEQLKGHPSVVEGITVDQAAAFCEVLLRDAGVDTLTGIDLVDVIDHYARNWSLILGLPMLVTKSVFSDGVSHGIALARGLSADPPPERS